jgi:hypothetical protein
MVGIVSDMPPGAVGFRAGLKACSDELHASRLALSAAEQA